MCILEGNNCMEWDGGKLIRTAIWKGPHLSPYQSFNSLKKKRRFEQKTLYSCHRQITCLDLGCKKNESRLCHLSCLERDNNSSFGSIQSSLGGMLSEPWVVVEASASGWTQIASLKPNWTSIKEGQKVPIHLKNVFIFQGDLSIDSPEPFNLSKVTYFLQILILK